MKKSICYLTDFSSIYATVQAHKYLITKLSHNFDNVYFIDSSNFELNFFKKIRSRKVLKNKIFKILNFKNKNLKFLNIKSSKNFKTFFESSKSIIINNFGKTFSYFYLHYLVKKNNIPQVQILNIDIVSFQRRFENKFFYKRIFYFFQRTLPSKLITFLSIIKILPKIDLCFTTNLTTINKINSYNFFGENFRYIKSCVPINSLAYDESLNFKTSNKYILYIDTNVNHPDSLLSRGKLAHKKILFHYNLVIKFLKKIQNIYKKKIIVAIHPLYSIKETKKNLPGFTIKKYKTIELIKKSHLVIFFNSTVIHYAFVMNKKIIGLYSPVLGEDFRAQSTLYPARAGIPLFDISKDFLLSKNQLDRMLLYKNNKKLKFFKSRFLIKEYGDSTDKIIKIIKERYY